MRQALAEEPLYNISDLVDDSEGALLLTDDSETALLRSASIDDSPTGLLRTKRNAPAIQIQKLSFNAPAYISNTLDAVAKTGLGTDHITLGGCLRDEFMIAAGIPRTINDIDIRLALKPNFLGKVVFNGEKYNIREAAGQTALLKNFTQTLESTSGGQVTLSKQSSAFENGKGYVRGQFLLNLPEHEGTLKLDIMMLVGIPVSVAKAIRGADSPISAIAMGTNFTVYADPQFEPDAKAGLYAARAHLPKDKIEIAQSRAERQGFAFIVR